MDVCMWEEGEWMCTCVGEGEWVCSVRKWRNSVHHINKHISPIAVVHVEPYINWLQTLHKL